MPDPREFDAFYAATSRRMVAQVYAMIGDLTEAEDAVQEAYARAWQRWPKLSGYADPAGWVRKVAYRVSVSSWRRAVNRLRAHERHGPPDHVPELTPDTVALADALARIPAPQRRAIVLHHLVGLTVDEVAEETGSRPGTVKSWLARGRQALGPHLDENEGDPAHLGSNHA